MGLPYNEGINGVVMAYDYYNLYIRLYVSCVNINLDFYPKIVIFIRYDV